MTRKRLPGPVTEAEVRAFADMCDLDLDGWQVDVVVRILNDKAEGIVDALEISIQTARAAGTITDQDRGAVEGLRLLAWSMRSRSEDSKDNVTIPMFFKAAEQLGLTPSGRGSLALKAKGVRPGAGPTPPEDEVTLDSLQAQAGQSGLRVVR